MTYVIRNGSHRPTLICVGRSAANLVDRHHEDLDLVDIWLVDFMTSSATHWPGSGAVIGQALTVVLFDGQDEYAWPALRAVLERERARSTDPLWLVWTDSRGNSDRTPMFRRLARKFGICVVDAGGCDPLAVALSPAAALFRSGLTGIDHTDVAMFASSGAVGRALRIPSPPDLDIFNALVVMRCSSEVTLHAINEMSERLTAIVPNADMLLATPTTPYVGQAALDCIVIAFSR